MDDDGRVPTALWVAAHMRTCAARAVPAYLRRRGSEAGGLVVLHISRPDGEARILSQTRDFDGRIAWLPASGGAWLPAADAEAYLARAVARDPDLWIVDIEHPDGWHPFDGRELAAPDPQKSAAEALFRPGRPR